MLTRYINPKEIWSIPNILSLLRIALIPFVMYNYLKGAVNVAGVALIISGLTDAADGFIARRFGQITSLGKILDPLADKLTQVCVAVGLCLTYRALLPLALVLGVKELLMGLMGITLLRRGKQPFAARWWGKLATIAFYVAATAIMLFGHGFSRGVIRGISLTVAALLAYSLFRYYDMLKSQLTK
ncbi:MAG: CDP-alcohol phosphatidyltransferase family protein [Clostridiales bacterium]|nr:CDP-alcohol phosphatidyltransferase family protein [Clostridiales bacterium]